jgi:alkaline phosphatase
VDWASHANDPIGVISDVLAFDEAVAEALAFARRDGQTLVLAFTDHGNGGMSLGSKKTDRNYDSLPLEALVAPLKRASLTGEGIEKVLGADRTEEGIREAVRIHYGIGDLTEEETAAIQKAPKGRMNNALGPIMSSRSAIGWTTNGHTGEDVFLYAFGPKRPVGLFQNTELAHICARALGFELAAVDRRLFAPAEEIAAKVGAEMEIRVGEAGGGALLFSREGKEIEVRLGKNQIRLGDRKMELEGLAVFAPKTGKVYLPRETAEKAAALLSARE